MVLLACILPRLLHAQAVRFVNGTTIPGNVTGVNNEGVQIRTSTGVRTLTWDTLSPGTRYRYQPLYRANYQAVLQGVPRARWTNAADPQVEAELKNLSASVPSSSEAPAQKPAVVPERSQSLNIFDNLRFAPVEVFRSSAFPGASFRDLEMASFVGFQYGSAATDVVYFAFEAAGPNELSDVVFVYSPGTAEFTNTVKIKGFKKTAGTEPRITFRSIRVQTAFGKVRAILEFEPEITGSARGSVFLTITGSLTYDRDSSRFQLVRNFSDLLTGDGIVPVKGIWDLPSLWMACRPKPDGGAQATLILSMGNLVFVPRSGMESRAALTITDSAGQVVYRDTVKMDLFPPPLDGIVTDIKRVSAGQTYKVDARIDLGPFLGVASATEKLEMPAR